jgi:hypothetical protein
MEAVSLTHSTAPSPVFEGGVEKRRSGSTLSKPQLSGWGAEGLNQSLFSLFSPYFFLNRSILPAVSKNFCFPVKNGWQLEQIST